MSPSDPPPLLTTAEAAQYLRFRSAAGIRGAVHRGELQPFGVGAKGSHLFTLDELHRFATARAARYARARLGVPGQKDAGGDEGSWQGHTLSGRVSNRRRDVLHPREGNGSTYGQEEGGREAL